MLAIRPLSTATVALAILAVLAVVVSPSAQSQTFTSLYSFKGSPDGATPLANPILAKGRVVYGTTEAGGSSSFGTIYSFSSGTETVLYNFTNSSDGAEPFAGLVMDESGTLYGTAIGGGSSGAGTVFSFSSGTFTTLYSFTGGTDGGYPFGGLVLDKKGNLYGTTQLGGSSGFGTVFEVNISSKTETVLYSFTGGSSDGEYPGYGYLLRDKSGNLYGMTQQGGAYNLGTLFEVSAKGKETVLHSFASGTDGAFGFEQSLATDDKGNLFGTCQDGGTSNAGVVFKLNIKSKKETILYTFTGGADGGYPASGLVRDSKGNLFGTTQIGGANNDGVVFVVKGKKETVLHSFDGTDGSSPLTSPLVEFKGTLYGSTIGGGADGDGTIFSLKP